MKYTKFEEWMVGKTVTYGNYNGKVIEGREVGDSLVYVSWEGKAGDFTELVEELDFVEEPEITQVEIDWQVGQIVWDLRNGRGVIEGVNDGDDYPVHVVFDLKDCYGGTITDTYTIDGKYVKTQKARSLFFSEPVVTAELYPPNKPFTPTLNKGDKVVIDTGDRSFIATIKEEKEDEVLIEGQVSGIRYPKNCIKIYKLGEEVKL